MERLRIFKANQIPNIFISNFNIIILQVTAEVFMNAPFSSLGFNSSGLDIFKEECIVVPLNSSISTSLLSSNISINYHFVIP